MKSCRKIDPKRSKSLICVSVDRHRPSVLSTRISLDVAIAPWSALFARESRRNIRISVALRNEAEQITAD